MERERPEWQQKTATIIFGHQTPLGQAFDVLLLWSIMLSVLAAILESVESIEGSYGGTLRTIEWLFTILFTIEYFIRVLIAPNRRKYITSFFGVVDLLAVIPTYLSLFFVGTQYLLVIRALRLLRIFRVLHLPKYQGEAKMLSNALMASKHKIFVFLYTVLTLVIIIGTIMYLIEGGQGGFSSIPRGIYWAIVTLTTVGYGDIAPQSVIGQFMASIVMVLGYAIIAVPTGIVTVALSQQSSEPLECKECTCGDHSIDAIYCKLCGNKL